MGGVANNLTIIKPDNDEAVLSAYGNSQGTGRLYCGAKHTHGGGIIYNGDASPAFAGSSEDAISFYRTSYQSIMRFQILTIATMSFLMVYWHRTDPHRCLCI